MDRSLFDDQSITEDSTEGENAYFEATATPEQIVGYCDEAPISQVRCRMGV